MDKWAEKKQIEAYNKAFALCDESSVWQTLFNIRDFAYQLIEELNDGFDLNYPIPKLDRISNMLSKLHSHGSVSTRTPSA
ncbi:MAG: hypothetical protein GY866_33055 [Proteobacteria bacterium]|nr:hypothetical protein [Pseudomonadota bacterium]